MENYRKIALRYLTMNKKRSIIAIVGAWITATILFAFLNFSCGFLVHLREVVREDGDYEMIFFTETREKAEQILGDSRVKSAYIGPYYQESYINGTKELIRPNALYVNVSEPYRINACFKQLSNEYQVEGEINDYLASLYFQGADEEGPVALLLFVLLISYIFAIFGVGIVRNAIQLCALENIRDYGNLRCIGASKSQLKGIIYLQGAILELIGIGLGVLLGTIISIVIGTVFHVKVGFHPIGILLILILFMGDLYFTMGENSKLITGMSPLSAIRGEYRLKKEKIKVRGSNIFGKILGVDGDYAYKSLMQNRGRFFRTIGAMIFGIAMFISLATAGSTVGQVLKEQLESYKYYQLYFENPLEASDTIDVVQGSLPSAKGLEQISELREITEAKRIYSTQLWVADMNGFYSHYGKQYAEETDDGLFRTTMYETYNKPLDDEEKFQHRRAMIASMLATVTCYGYDETDYQRYESALIEGTLDVSDHGIVIVNEGHLPRPWEESDEYYVDIIDVEIMDYQLGDTIPIVDMKEFRERVLTELVELEKEKEAAIEELERSKEFEEYELISKLEDLESEFDGRESEITYETWLEMIEEGRYTNYTVEGILKDDVNRQGEEFRIVLPKEQYFALTGTDDSMYTGIQYHLDRIPFNKNLSTLMWEVQYDGVDFQNIEETCLSSEYVWILDEISGMQKGIWVVALIVVFVVLMASLNFINATASNLYLRRKEFAQLRVIGTSKGRLMKMVLYEGIITTIISNVIGVIIGCGVSYVVYISINMIVGVKFQFPIVAVILCMLGSFLLLCGAIYSPMRKLSQSTVEDLTAGGD